MLCPCKNTTGWLRRVAETRKTRLPFLLLIESKAQYPEIVNYACESTRSTKLAKRAKAVKEDGSVPTHGGNGFNADQAKAFKARVESLMGDLAVERSEYMNNCKSIRADVKIVLDEAKAAGIPKKEFKQVIETARLVNKINSIREDLVGDEQDNYDLLVTALGGFGELPLGQAALARAGTHTNGQAVAAA